jgi:hypothetical protein
VFPGNENASFSFGIDRKIHVRELRIVEVRYLVYIIVTSHTLDANFSNMAKKPFALAPGSVSPNS